MFARYRAAFLALPLMFASVPAMAAPQQPASGEASIPFVNHGGVWNWQADGSRGVYVQDQHRQWYYAKLMSNCFDLPFANSIGFETRGIDTLDRFGTLVVRGQHCPITSFTYSAGPPARTKKG